MPSDITESDERDDDGAGAQHAAISRHVVRLYAEYTGRGPTRARTTIRDNVIVCVTQDNLTKAERRLADDGERDMVAALRRKFQATMQHELVAGVEQLTGRRVVAMLGDHDMETDHAVSVFVLDGASAS